MNTQSSDLFKVKSYSKYVANSCSEKSNDLPTGAKLELPWWEKYTLTIKEASRYFGIGEKALRRFVREHKYENFIVQNGAKVVIIRKDFETYLSNNSIAF